MSDQQKPLADKWVDKLKSNPLIASVIVLTTVCGLGTQLVEPVSRSLNAFGLKPPARISDAEQDQILREYQKEINSLFSNASLPLEGSKQKSLARSMTLTVLPRLDSIRRSSIFEFLREADFPILSGNDKEWGGNFKGYDLRKTNMSHSRLVWAWFENANLAGASLARADLRNAVFINANLENANLVEANLNMANLIRANLSSASLRSANLKAAFLRSAILNGADLSGADLEYADLGNVKWDSRTVWPSERKAFAKATLPAELKKVLGII